LRNKVKTINPREHQTGELMIGRPWSEASNPHPVIGKWDVNGQ
jgi:hypothetical protein